MGAMADPIDNKLILEEILAVLKKHSIPANTLMLELSLLNDDFEELFPDLKDYKAGIYYRSLVVDETPAVVRASRRVPFSDIERWFQVNVLPFVEELAAEIRQEFSNLGAHVSVSHRDGSESSVPAYLYDISIECRRLTEDRIKDRNTVVLIVGARQRDAVSLPIASAIVGRLVNEESGGDWGIEIVANIVDEREVSPDYLDREVVRTLPTLRDHMLTEVKKLSQD